jgi:hypothetical protein
VRTHKSQLQQAVLDFQPLAQSADADVANLVTRLLAHVISYSVKTSTHSPNHKQKQAQRNLTIIRLFNRLHSPAFIRAHIATQSAAETLDQPANISSLSSSN